VRIRTADGEAFLKYNTDAPAGMFAAEAEGLRALRAVGTSLRVPEVLDVLDARGPHDAGALLLEWLEPARPGAGYWDRLGRGLAELHRVGRGGWGWEGNGFIGPLPVGNDPSESWATFWHERRLEPMLRRVRGGGWSVGRGEEWDTLWRVLPTLLEPAEAEGASLLHGDLWSGNVLATPADGGVAPALVDPAVYRGHREVDLGMAELFGGFPAEFFDAYRDAWPTQPGEAGRRAAYQLFYLLVHVKLFGAGYVARSERALRTALEAA
jgi:protein-ribulosamine 3-kinase